MGSWREAFLRAPYLRDTLVAMGVISETFETADDLGQVRNAARDVLARRRGGPRGVRRGLGDLSLHPRLSGRARPLLHRAGPGPAGEELEQWAHIKAAAAGAILDTGGTITHHHAVGRDHRTWYDRQRPEPFAAALRAAKAALDPAGALNPGVLID